MGKPKQLTVAEVMDLPPTVNLETVARAFNIGRGKAYLLARTGELPVPVLRLGRALLVTKASLLIALGLDTVHATPPPPAPVRTVRRTVGVAAKR